MSEGGRMVAHSTAVIALVGLVIASVWAWAWLGCGASARRMAVRGACPVPVLDSTMVVPGLDGSPLLRVAPGCP